MFSLSKYSTLPFLTLLLHTSAAYSSANSTDEPEELHTIDSKIAPGATISYKQTHICETTPGVQAFSGYINLPSSLISDVGGAAEYNASIFYWYFESRKDPKNAPLSIYVGGGPGTTSLGGVTAENGPCYINPDSNSTRLNPWSWNNNVNMLYIDQPVKVGFSYTDLVPSVLDLLTGTIAPMEASEISNATFVTGILPGQNISTTVNTTANAARILWGFTQIWLQEFPEHESSNDRISLWTNSYGGHWGPGIMAYFQSQNENIQNGTITNTQAKYLHLDTLGITNGCIDVKTEAQFYPEFAVNNTYGFQAYSEDVYLEARNNLTKKGGCSDLLDQCRALSVSDPKSLGANETVNAACALATQYCFGYVQGAFTTASDRNPFDISREKHSVFPPEYIIGYMNQDWVQRELGVPLNFSISSNDVLNTFFGVTGDPVKVSIDNINYVAQSGIKVALIYGDRDYRCNWLGGEAVSLAMSYSSAPSFRSAGYEPIHTNSTFNGGVVRQHNKISFSRVFDAGHAVGAYQPETVSKIFDRVMFDSDVATGNTSTAGNSSYSSTGPESSLGIKNVLPPSPKNECYLWDAFLTCVDDELLALANGTAVVKDFILVSG
ncbi:alpha/beta-hydrolase [Dothidotthia symphoricarpi CBS 119687]|uniref:Alpha/beta-hydrolase n=1 Tax=Dothidotthia symphoricarpi CBS 119687 TaxID=1392245 RepID=A0A6A6A5V6_9PLEO|nr:alpha/beta-hydrolase [Dothidotthia symphoricarpi CBS 119687]KAF2126297.1 alpha/beta-hydrolase [Dothidotthia symphoricarpi CBS 119687]